ncbi:MAG TPA: hypothetical protein VLX59_19415, partial [Acidimicrobiales bacterium]|nr:hypothetical protein [Acidimicrobiales bacterium]
GDVGGIQNTVTNLGASIGTALAGAVLISALTTSFLTGINNNPEVPKSVQSNATAKLAGGIPFVSDAQLRQGLADAGVPARAADAIVAENSTARLNGLRASLSILAVIGMVGLFFTRRIPREQPGATPTEESAEPVSLENPSLT